MQEERNSSSLHYLCNYLSTPLPYQILECRSFVRNCFINCLNDFWPLFPIQLVSNKIIKIEVEKKCKDALVFVIDIENNIRWDEIDENFNIPSLNYSRIKSLFIASPNYNLEVINYKIICF